MKRLGIVVPYRDRESHLAQLLRHLQLYFARDKVDQKIPYSVLVVEQESGLPFNRGAMKNIGFALGRERCAYTCFHDVDLLPIWADYSWSDQPMPIAWHGADVRPVSASQGNFIANDPAIFFGAVVLCPNDRFAQVNGYSNRYWGWGYEDEDLRRRFLSAGVACGRRSGTFQPLPHDSEAFRGDGKPSAAGEINRRLFEQIWPQNAISGTGGRNEDGVSTVSFDILERRNLGNSRSGRDAQFEKVVVRLKTLPTEEQTRAFATPSIQSARLSMGWSATIKG